MIEAKPCDGCGAPILPKEDTAEGRRKARRRAYCDPCVSARRRIGLAFGPAAKQMQCEKAVKPAPVETMTARFADDPRAVRDHGSHGRVSRPQAYSLTGSTGAWLASHGDKGGAW